MPSDSDPPPGQPTRPSPLGQPPIMAPPPVANQPVRRSTRQHKTAIKLADNARVNKPSNRRNRSSAGRASQSSTSALTSRSTSRSTSTSTSTALWNAYESLKLSNPDPASYEKALAALEHTYRWEKVEESAIAYLKAMDQEREEQGPGREVIGVGARVIHADGSVGVVPFTAAQEALFACVDFAQKYKGTVSAHMFAPVMIAYVDNELDEIYAMEEKRIQ